MAIFGSKKRASKKVDAAQSAPNASGMRESRAHVLRHARITEKATINESNSVYVFDIATSATKRDVITAMRDIYKVVPVKVRVAKVPSKAARSMRTGITGVKRGGKKAYVYLKKGETISIS